MHHWNTYVSILISCEGCEGEGGLETGCSKGYNNNQEWGSRGGKHHNLDKSDESVSELVKTGQDVLDLTPIGTLLSKWEQFLIGAEQGAIVKKAIVHASSFLVLRIYKVYTFANHIGHCYQAVFCLNNTNFVS